MTVLAPVPNKSKLRSLLLAFLSLPVLSLLGFFWLEIPDSHIWQLGLSLVVALLLAGAFLWVVSALVRNIRQPAQPCSHLLGALLLAVWVMIKWSLVRVIAHVDDHAMERAGFLNSKLSASMRSTFTFDRMIAWQHDFALLLLWIIVPALITPFFVETVARGVGPSVWRAAAGVLRRWQHWLLIILCDVAVYWFTAKLTGWRPSHSVHGELFSLGLRLALCYAVDFALVVCILAVDSKLLAGEHVRRNPVAEPAANAV